MHHQISRSIYFLRRSDSFYEILEKWSEVTSTFHLEFEHDKLLNYLAYLLVLSTIPYLLVCFSFSVDMHYNMLNGANSSFEKYLTSYYSFSSWNDIFPYQFEFGWIQLIFRTIQTHSIVIIYTLIIFFARAISFQYKKLLENACQVKSSEAHYADVEQKGRGRNPVINFK